LFDPTGFIGKFEGANARRPYRILGVVAALTLLSIVGASNLGLQTSRKALFPQDEPALQRLNSFLENFGAGSDLMLVVEDAPRRVLEEFSSELASRLDQRDGVREASERLDTEFFYKHAFLMIPTDGLEQIEGKIDEYKDASLLEKTVDTDEALHAVGDWLDDPPLLDDTGIDIGTGEETLKVVDFLLEEWVRWIDSKDEPTSVDWPRAANHPEAEAFLKGNGYFSSHEGDFIIVLVSRDDPSEEYDVLHPFIEGVRETSEGLQTEYAEAGRPVPRIGITGLPAVVHEEFSYVQSDILFIVITAGILVMLLILFWMRSWRRALVIFIPMGVGTVWNAGLTYLTVGHLTMITAGFSAILFGLGVDYGIFLSTRILEEVKKGLPLTEAIATGSSAAVKALITAGGATVLIFVSLAFVPFKGFSELGLVASTGVLMVLLSTFLTLPALMALLRPPATVSGSANTPAGKNVGRTRLTLSRTASLLVVIFAFSAAAAGIAVGTTIPFNYNSMELLPEDSEASNYQRKLVEHSDFQPEIVIFTAGSIEEARHITEGASKLPTVSRVQSIVDLFPGDMENRVRIARRIGDTVANSHAAVVLAEQEDVRLTPENVKSLGESIEKTIDLLDDIQEQAFSAGHAGIVEVLEKMRGRLETLGERASNSPDLTAARTNGFFNLLLSSTRSTVDVLTGWKDARPLTPEGLPPSIRDRFFSDDGKMAVYAFPKMSVYQLELLDLLMKDVYSVSEDATGFPSTHQVFSRMAIHSFLQGTLVAAAVALLWILLAVRSLRGFLIASLPLVVGEGWLLGILAVFEIDFGYANIIGVPMVMALAVDYGVWFAHRNRELPDISAWEAGAVASKAILLAAGTTLAGLGAITMAEYRGVSMMGVCITIGLLCCVIAARLVSPAVAHIVGGRKR